jgi:CBS domain-containing protein
MNHGVVSVAPEDSAYTAARLLDRHNIGSVPVCATDGALRGIVTDRDIVTRCTAAERAPAATLVREIMSKSVLCVSPQDDAREAARKMAEHQVRRLPVVENNRLVGMLSLGDISRAYEMEASRALCEISSNVKRT